jgi:hypothetical protein
LAACGGTALIISIIWLFIAQYVVGPFVWLSILVLNAGCIAGSVLLYFYYNSRVTAFNSNSNASGAINITLSSYSYQNNLGFLDTTTKITQSDVNLALGIFIAVVIITAIILLITLVMLKRISMAVQIINEASQAFRSLPGIQFFPIFFVAALLVLFTYFVIVMLYIMSPTSDNITISAFNLKFTSKNNSYYMMWYHLAGFLWTYFAIEGMCNLSIAGAVADWYWTTDKSTLKAPLTRATWRAFRYSFGSVLIGSLLITIVELIRIVLYKVQRHVAKSKVTYLKYIVACAQCCMKCVEIIVKWINRNAYVYIAITGKAFFESAGAATALLIRNSAKTVAVTYVGEAALILAKLAIVGINTLGAYWFLAMNSLVFAKKIYNPTATIVFVAVESFLVASVFFSNYQLAIDTIFLSALEDMDKNDGSAARPYHMSASLQKILNTRNDQGGKISPNKEINQL